MHDTAHFHSFPQLMIIIINKVPNTRSVVISVTKYPIQQSFLLCPKLSPSCPARRKKIAKNRVTQEGRPCGRASWQAVVALAANAKAAALKYCNHPRQPLPLITSYRLRHHAAVCLSCHRILSAYVIYAMALDRRRWLRKALWSCWPPIDQQVGQVPMEPWRCPLFEAVQYKQGVSYSYYYC